MRPEDLSALWTTLGTALADHLWQSTLFVLGAALLTLALRKNQARIRYWIWLAASLKFMIPFAPLIAIGKRLSRFRHASMLQSGFSTTIEELGQPFTRPVATAIGAAAAPVHSSVTGPLFSTVLVLIWLAGFLAAVAIWCVRWRRISDAIRESIPLRTGREIEALRRIESAAGITGQLQILSSPTTLEPGIFGIVHPVLLWPQGISEHLTQEQLEGVLAHELCHVRRRDNLAALIHMIVEALFWFHPFVWWVGACLVDERERACDEQVLEFGSPREVYAESILKVCEFCVGSPLACVAGVTGSDLKKRMVHIMSEHIGRKLDFSRKLLLTAAAFVAIAVPVVFGVFNATPGRAQSTDAATTTTFQSFSIKPSQSPNTPTYAGTSTHMVRMMLGPDGFFADATMATLIQEAYGVQANQISGGPDWLNTDRFDVQAKVDKSLMPDFGPDPAKYGSLIHQMLRAALAESTKLQTHTETKDLSAYALVIAEGGAKLQAATDTDSAGGGSMHVKTLVDMRSMTAQKGSGGQVVGLSAQRIPVADFAGQLSRQLGTPVVDQTNLKGKYNFSFQWAADAAPPALDSSAPATAEAVQSISTSLEQQLGLKLVPQTRPLPVVVIDHIEKPAED